jgi:hypothetical protein
VVGIAALLYLGLGGLVIHAIAMGSDPDSDLSDLDPVFDAIVACVYVAGAALLVTNARSGKPGARCSCRLRSSSPRCSSL